MSDLSPSSSVAMAAPIGNPVLPATAVIPASSSPALTTLNTPTGVASIAPASWRTEHMTGEYAVYADHPSLQDFKQPADVAKSYVMLREKMGGMVPLPKDDVSRVEFYKKLGVPEKPEGYVFEAPKELPQGMVHDVELDKGFQQWAHKYNLTPEQAIGLRSEFIKNQQATFGNQKSAIQQANDVALQALKVKWGGEYDQHVQNAILAIKEYAPPEVRAILNSNPDIGNNPHVLEMFSRLGAQLAQDQAKGHLNSGGSVSTMDQSRAAARLAYMKTDAETQQIQMNQRHPRHMEVKAEMAQLYKIAHPDPEESKQFI